VLSSFTAVISGQNMVSINWVTQSETNLAGYFIYRDNQPMLTNAWRISPLIEATNTSQTYTYGFTDLEVYPSQCYYYWLESVDICGSSYFHGPVFITLGDNGNNGSSTAPLNTELSNAYPNPFNPCTAISYSLKDAGDVTITIYNVRGQQVKSFREDHSSGGKYRIIWDGTNDQGKSMSSGIYYYHMKSGNYIAIKKMVLMK